MVNLSATSLGRTIIGDHLVWENHSCMPFAGAHLWMPQIERYRSSGFSLVHINIGDADVPLDQMVRTLAEYRAWFALNSARFALVRTVEDVVQAHRAGKLAICFDIEGAQAIGTHLPLIGFFYELGVKWMLMAYNCGNAVGAGCHDAVDHGLTPFGRTFVAEMDRVGMIKDVAHTGYRTAMDILAETDVPVNISHSNPRALNDHPRCVPDDLMKACAASGGVLGISGLGLFLGNNDASAESMARSIDYSVAVMGIDHVGLGLDYVFDQSGVEQGYSHKRHIWPEGFGYDAGTAFAPPEQLPEIVEALARRGYRTDDIAKVLGGNFLRVAGRIWR